jgi:hypothetical protein
MKPRQTLHNIMSVIEFLFYKVGRRPYGYTN